MSNFRKISSRSNQILKLLLKIVVTGLCIWYVSGKIDFEKAGSALQKADGFYLFLALIAFILSKLISAFRLNAYFRNIGIKLPEWQHIKLYWLGMFYNLFLPGSIGGDAYKVMLLTRKYTVPFKKTTAAVLTDRFSGLLGLGLAIAFYGVFVLKHYWQMGVVIAGALAAIALLYLLLKRWFPYFIPGFFSALLLGIAVQALQVISIYLITASLEVSSPVTSYIFIFLISSVLSVLPLTIGGLGIREVVFLEGSRYFGLSQETAVVISIIFYLVTLLTSAAGVIYVFKKNLAQKKDSLLSP